jgi:hypothetical protein
MSTNFPASVDSFPVHTDNVNEKVNAATINNLQDSVVAIEQTLGSGSSKPTSSPTVNTILLRDANGRSQVVDPSVSADISTKGYVDTQITNTKGGSTKTLQDLEILYWMGAI